MRGAHCGLLWLFALGACNAILDIHEHDLAHGAAGSGSGTTGASAGKPSTGGATGSPTSGGSAGTGGSDMPGGDGGVPRGGTAGTGGGGGTSSPGLAGEGGEQSGGTSSSGLAGEGGEQSGGRGDGACPNGFTGPDCAENIDDCASQPCGAKPNSHCVDGVATYTCVCDSGFTGSTCAPRLELLTPGFGLSLALAITPDGTVIVGNVQDTAQSSSHPFRWTEETGAVTLMSNSEPVDWGFATSVSTDGSVVGGYASTASGVGAYRWTQSTGIVKVGPGDQGFMNGNGSTLVGRDTTPSDGTHLWRWTSGTGVVDLGLFGSFARLEGLSSDGTAIIGSTDAGGFIWTSGDGIRTLGPSGVGMPGAVSADGRITVGVYTSNATAMAFVWKRPQDFADLDVGALTSTAATGLSSDGSVIVGTSAQDGWIWTSSTGARLLTDLLTAKGVDVSGYDSFQLKAVSDDGTIIVGSVTVLDSGVGSQAFIARLGD